MVLMICFCKIKGGIFPPFDSSYLHFTMRFILLPSYRDVILFKVKMTRYFNVFERTKVSGYFPMLIDLIYYILTISSYIQRMYSTFKLILIFFPLSIFGKVPNIYLRCFLNVHWMVNKWMNFINFLDTIIYTNHLSYVLLFTLNFESLFLFCSIVHLSGCSPSICFPWCALTKG